ncbi:hypothetical protein B0F90DRAFT_1826865 [Multifurca ochricompacta]|uniref:Uncharacterized protein n=1 Tax=Multifurca ochricompacta TaxID=376703 RepID=A0AAD4LW34_9AGAM|nr:hypothetical protein B0F90DRAFT_1826865 [Multifurca ochricompacta]
MQSKPFSFRAAVRGILHMPSRTEQPGSVGNVDPASSEPIGGRVDLAIGVIETSLATLKEVSSLAGKIPYISPIAGIILQALKMRDEVKVYKEEWGAVMQKLANVGSVFINVGEMCRVHDFKEDELPLSLRDILRALREDLDGMDDALQQCADVRGIKKVLLRTDMLRRVKQYDSKLSNVLQVFQANLTLSLLTQLIQECKGTPHPSEPSQTIESKSMLSKPQIFFGCNTELAQIIHMIFTNIGSHPT